MLHRVQETPLGLRAVGRRSRDPEREKPCQKRRERPHGATCRCVLELGLCALYGRRSGTELARQRAALFVQRRVQQHSGWPEGTEQSERQNAKTRFSGNRKSGLHACHAPEASRERPDPA